MAVLMNIQELSHGHTIRTHRREGAVINNQHLGMIVPVGKTSLRFESRSQTYLGDPQNPHKIYHNYVAIAKGFNVPAERVTAQERIAAPRL